MKVLIICTEKLPVPAIRGGAIQTYIDGALPVLKRDHQITVLGRDDEALQADEVREGIRYVRVGGGILETYRENVVQFLQSDEQSYDIIHIFNRPRLVNKVRELAPEAKIILSMHNDMFKPEKLQSAEGTLVVQNVDRIITISKYIGQTICSFYPEAAPKIQTIYSGVDLDRFVPSYSKTAQEMRNRLRSEHGLEGKKVILYAGRLSANKGIDVLVRAMPALAEKHDNIALVIMGSKWFSNNDITDYVAYVRALAERLPVTVIQTGFVAPDKIQEWFAASDIFVCTSQWQEPLARVHYEAMASALPIVTTNRGGNTEVIEPHKNGIIVENPAEPGEFAQHLSYLLSNPGVGEEMGRYGRSLAEKHYTWDRVVSDILSAWQQVERSELLDVAGLEHVEEYQAAEAPIAEMNAAGISPAAEELFEEEAVEAVGEDNLVEEVIESLETEGTSAPEAEMETVEEVEESETVEEESEQLVSEPEADAEEAETPAGEMEADPVEEVEESETVKEESEQLVSEPEADAEEAETPAGEMEADPVEEVEEFETVEEESEQLVSEPEADAEEIETPAAEAEAEPVEKAEESETVKEELEEVAVDSVEEEVEESEPATTVNPLEEKLVAFTNVIRGALGNQGAVQRKSKKSPPSRENSNALNTNNKDHATNLFILLALFYMREKKWI